MLNRLKALKRYKKQAAAMPRTMPELTTIEADLRSKAGAAQYGVHAYGKQLAAINAQLESVNAEATERMRLDKEAAAQAQPEQKES